MIKYYKELEKPNDFYLSFLNPYYKEFHTFTPPMSFYEEHYEIFDAISEINYLIDFIKDDVTKIGCLPFELDKRDEYYDAVIRMNQLIDDDYCYCNPIILFIRDQKENIIQDGHYFMPLDLGDLPFDRLEHLKEKYDYVSIKEIIDFYIEFLDALLYINPEIFKKYKRYYELFANAKKDFFRYRIDCYNEKIEKCFLPNAWFITPFGDLYNSFGYDGHKEANLLYNYWHWEEKFQSMDTRIETTHEQLKSLDLNRTEIIKNGYIRIADFKHYTNLSYNPISIEIPSDNYERYSSRKIYDLKTVKTVLGIVSAHASLNRFWLDLATNTNNPSLEFEKVQQITRGRIEEILVRCGGFHKIETDLKKTITTSSLDNLQMFEEYLKRGWNVSIISPIIINREKGIVEELDINSPYIERYLEKNIEPYKTSDIPGHGKIYCRHLGYGKL